MTLKNELVAKVVPPVAVRLPESEPPDCTATDGTVPVPMSMASEPMVTALAASKPVMLRVPPLAVVVAEQVLTPASKTPAPVLVNAKAPADRARDLQSLTGGGRGKRGWTV